MVTVHYIKGRVRKHKATMEDVMIMLGSKFGGLKYNQGIKNGYIKVFVDEKRFVIYPEMFKI